MKKGSEDGAPPKKNFRYAAISNLLVSGVGFFADAYDLFVIDFVVAILSATAYEPPTTGEKGLITSATLVGAVIGQLGFGVAADFLGRRIMFIATAVLTVIGALVSSLVGFGYQTRTSGFSVFYQLALCRLFLGIGIGGEYPLSATVTSEQNDDEAEAEIKANARGFWWYLLTKPSSLACVFSMQGFGMLVSPALVILFVATGMDLEVAWRVLLGLGALPSAVAFYFRFRMHTTKSDKPLLNLTTRQDSGRTLMGYPEENGLSSPTSAAGGYSPPVFSGAERNHEAIDFSAETATNSTVRASRVEKRDNSLWSAVKTQIRTLGMFKRALVGTALTWLIIDVTFYGTGSFKSTVVSEWFVDKIPDEGTDGDSDGDASQQVVAQFMRQDEMMGTVPILDGDLADADDFEEPLVLKRPLEFPRSRNQLQREAVEAAVKYVSSLWERHVEQQVVDAEKDDDDDNYGISSFVASSHSEEGSAPLRKLGHSAAVRRNLQQQAVGGLVVACVSVPGYFLSVFFLHRVGLRPLTFFGFWLVALAFGLMSIVQFCKVTNKTVNLLLFGLTFLFTNFGPNTTTFILPTTIYPSSVRATCHGFSAAMGKVGGVIGTSLFGPVNDSLGLKWLLLFCAFVAIIGAIVTYFFVPTDAKAKEILTQFEMDHHGGGRKDGGRRRAAGNVASSFVEGEYPTAVKGHIDDRDPTDVVLSPFGDGKQERQTTTATGVGTDASCTDDTSGTDDEEIELV